MKTFGTTRLGSAGFTLIETVFAAAILGLLAVYAVMKLATPATMTLEAQARSLADLVRRAQSLAMARGQRMSVSVATSGANGRVAIACASGTMPCSTDTSLTVAQGAVVGSAGTLYFNTLGQPVNSAGTPLAADAGFTLSYTTLGHTETYTVTVAALTGRVSVSP
jgi:prepilin-type N-terminal cleavage/methylation domain-containing protein